jgi:glycosyltransferase involved in cell wall biosynthesis
MSCGCAIVTTATCDIPSIIQHGVNGFISNDENELRSYCKQLLSDQELAKKMGLAARETIKEKFAEDRFVSQWNKVFNQAIRIR